MQEPYTVTQIMPHMWEIFENGVRCFLFEGAERAMLVDTGFGTGDLAAMVQSLTSKPVFVLNTHADRDHIGCNHQFETVYMHPAEFDRYMLTDTYETIQKPPAPIWKGEELDLGTFAFEIVLIPGHTPGSIALFEKEKRFLISGDSVAEGGAIYMFGAGRNLPAYLASIQKLRTLVATHIDVIYASHHVLRVAPATLNTLIAGGTKLLARELEGTSAAVVRPQLESLCKLYWYENVAFLY